MNFNAASTAVFRSSETHRRSENVYSINIIQDEWPNASSAYKQDRLSKHKSVPLAHKYTYYRG